MPNQEIERKFLVTEVPKDLEKYPRKDITQGYLAIGADRSEVRLRKKGNKFYETVKSGMGIVRNEIEVEITENQFNALWPATENKQIKKERYEIPFGERVIELDIYLDDLSGLITAEVEFPDLESIDNFEKPEWFGKDVSFDERYKNQFLALNGMPEVRK